MNTFFDFEEDEDGERSTHWSDRPDYDDYGEPNE